MVKLLIYSDNFVDFGDFFFEDSLDASPHCHRSAGAALAGKATGRELRELLKMIKKSDFIFWLRCGDDEKKNGGQVHNSYPPITRVKIIETRGRVCGIVCC